MTPDPLTKDAVKYLRQAKSVVFRSREIGAKYEQSTIELELSTEPKVETSIEVACKLTSHNGPKASAFDMIHGAQYYPTWGTFARSIRVGDLLTLLWGAGHDNQYTKDANLHCDHLSIAIDRAGKRWGEFMINVSVCPDNSARMVQP